MKSGAVIFIIIVLIVIGGAIYLLNKPDNGGSNEGVSSNVPVPGNENVKETVVEEGGEEGNTIKITSSGFSPSSLEIKAGEIVNFVNKDSRAHWPASAVHPTHTVYPGSDIRKCGTAEQARIFDACKGLAQDEEWSFTFNEKGSWTYHDHLNPGLRGMIVVK